MTKDYAFGTSVYPSQEALRIILLVLSPKHCVSLGQSNRSSSHCSDNQLHVALFWEEFGVCHFFHRTICRPCWSSWCFSSTSSLVHCPVCGPMKRTVGHASLAAWQLPKHQNGSKPENHEDKTVEVSYLFSALVSCQRSAIRFLTGSRLRIPTLEHLRNLRGLFGFGRI